MSNVIVLGAGMVGSAMALDLAEEHQVTMADLDSTVLNKLRERDNSIKTRQLDVTHVAELQNTIKQHDLAICAVPGFLGFRTLKAVIEADMNVIDISFFPENALELDGLAKDRGITAIVDCGVAPGMDNLILGYHNEKMNVTDFECLVGGLPEVRKWPFYYKAPFSPVDVIEEYTRPARYIDDGKLVIREPLTDCEFVEFDGVGTLESFNSDGLRSLIYTMPHIPNMKEKTLRYPGHVEYIRALKESGFFSRERIETDGNMVSPLEFTSKILFREWKLGENEKELTVMRVTLRGKNDRDQTEEIVYDLHDKYCTETGISSMARTTGYIATAVANLFLDGLFSEKGVFPPELIGRYEACFSYILKYLEKRDIHYIKSSRLI